MTDRADKVQAGKVQVGEVQAGEVAVAEEWVTVADLVDEGRANARFEALVAALAATFPAGADEAMRRRVAAARFCYLWSWFVAVSSLTPLLTEGIGPDPVAANAAVLIWGAHPVAARFDGNGDAISGPVEGDRSALFARWLDRLLTDHIAVLHRAVAERWNLGKRGLMGDLATNVAGVFRSVAHTTGDVVSTEHDARTMLALPALAGLGEICVVEAADRREVMYERLTCCLYIKVAPAAYCANCSLLAPAERTRRMVERAGSL